MNAVLRPPIDRRHAALALTALVHLLLLFGWQMTRHPLTLPQAEPRGIQWIDLRPRAQAPAQMPEPAPAQAPERMRLPARVDAAPPVPVVPVLPVAPSEIAPPVRQDAAGAAPAAASAPAAGQAAAAASAAANAAVTAPAGAPTGALIQGALRAAGGVDKALRKENRAYITAPLDSAQLRMQRGMEAAHDAVPPKLWEAPRVDELVNDTGDGARHTRIVSGLGTMCEIDRAPTTSIDMIEKHGKRRFTNCPQHETPAGSQAWRTARD